MEYNLNPVPEKNWTIRIITFIIIIIIILIISFLAYSFVKAKLEIKKESPINQQDNMQNIKRNYLIIPGIELCNSSRVFFLNQSEGIKGAYRMINLTMYNHRVYCNIIDINRNLEYYYDLMDRQIFRIQRIPQGNNSFKAVVDPVPAV